MNRWSLPIGVIAHPFGESPDPIPVVDFARIGRFGVIRCPRCRTYINPFCQFTEGGRRMICNVCRTQGGPNPQAKRVHPTKSNVN